MSNPADALEHNWQAICAVFMHKLQQHYIHISLEDMQEFMASGATTIVINESAEGLHFRLTNDNGAKVLATRHALNGKL